jgi:hypothetical protein
MAHLDSIRSPTWVRIALKGRLSAAPGPPLGPTLGERSVDDRGIEIGGGELSGAPRLPGRGLTEMGSPEGRFKRSRTSAAQEIERRRDQSLVDARDRSFQSAPCFCQFIRMWRLVAFFLPSATDWLSPTQWNRTIAAGPTT